MRLSLTDEDLAKPAGEALLRISVRVTQDGRVSQGGHGCRALVATGMPGHIYG